MGAATSSCRRPFGPCTTTSRPLMVTSTPLGTAPGIRPVTDLPGSLPDVGEAFPAHALPLGLLVSHQACRCRDDCHAEAAEHARQVVLARVDPQAWLGHALDARDGALPRRPVLQGDDEALADFGVLDLPAPHLALPPEE